VAVSGRREQEPSFFTVIVWRDQAEHAAESLSKGSRVVIMGRLQQRSWTAEDGSARSTVEVIADELGPSLRWATATTTRTTRNQDHSPTRQRSGERDAGEGAACQRSAPPFPILRVSREEFLYELKAGPAGGLRPPSGPATTRRSPATGLTLKPSWSP
jgi:single stranded DNA-binding protein